MPPLTPGPPTHEQLLGLVQPVGLVVAPAVLSALQLFPNQSTAYLSAKQRQLEGLLEERESAAGEPIQVVPSFQLLATELLDWGEADLIAAADKLQAPPLIIHGLNDTNVHLQNSVNLIEELQRLGEIGRSRIGGPGVIDAIIAAISAP